MSKVFIYYLGTSVLLGNHYPARKTNVYDEKKRVITQNDRRATTGIFWADQDLTEFWRELSRGRLNAIGVVGDHRAPDWLGKRSRLTDINYAGGIDLFTSVI